MKGTNKPQEYFEITSVSRADILQAFSNCSKKQQRRVKARVEKMSDDEMRNLASRMANDYCEQLYWTSLSIIFEEKFLEEE